MGEGGERPAVVTAGTGGERYVAVERELRALCAACDYDAAAAGAIAAYGAEILAFVRAHVGSEAVAWDVFSSFSDDLSRGIAGFAWRCSLRAWAYALARERLRCWATGPGF